MNAKAVVPGDAGLDEMAVGYKLHASARAMVVKPTDVAQIILAQAVAPQGQLVGLDGMDAELDGVSALAPLRPCIAEETIGEKAKMRRPMRGNLDLNALGPITAPGEAHFARPSGDIGVDSAGRGGADDDRRPLPGADFHLHIGQGRVVFVANITDKHRITLRFGKDCFALF
jgi:hypothetical protein